MRQRLALVRAVRCFLACFQSHLDEAETYAYQALPDLPQEDWYLRNGVYGSLGDTYRRSGRWDEARQCYLKTLEFPRAPAFQAQSALAFGALADLELRQGHLRGAAAYWKRAFAVIDDRRSWGSLPLSVIGWVYIRMGEILYEWNALEEARDYVTQGLERVELVGDPQGMVVGCLSSARLLLAANEKAAAVERLEQVRPLLEQRTFPDWFGRLERLQVELWLAEGKISPAATWADKVGESAASDDRAGREETYLAAARALIAKGDAPSLERTLTLLRPLLQAAQVEGRKGIQIEALALQALAHWRRGEHADAMTALERCLRLAEPEDYVRLFVDLGLPMARLLQEARERSVLTEYVAHLLTAFDGDHSLGAQGSVSLPEPLSQREQEVLKLIAAGLTNREIAEALVISSETVKKHTGAIYSKLGVSNRTEAAHRARELGLLE
jgi:LuxR family maltose regulon positive regulatory protein